MDRLILSRRSGKNVLGAGAAAILSPPLAFGRPQGPMPGPGSHNHPCAPSSAASPVGVTLPERIGGSRWREPTQAREGLNLSK
jgi:hypothetical protein